MIDTPGRRGVVSLRPALAMAALIAATAGLAQAPGAPPSGDETPGEFHPRVETFDYVKREVKIPMRDGIGLKTVILIPRGASHAPMLLTRTPYGATERIIKNTSAHLSTVIGDSDVADDAVISGGYIRVMQDIRGKHDSEGEYMMTRPLSGPFNPSPVDHATDAFDTIDWLVKNVPESNGRVGILGISYDGFTSLMALVHPHPALRAAVPINAMADGWMGDDWFHNGAFRLDSLRYFHDQQATRDGGLHWWTDRYDDYDSWLSAGSTAEVVRRRGLDQVGFTAKVLAHPAYDRFWQEQAMDRILAREGVTVPTMLVHSLWDQEDIYGNMAVYEALAARHAARAPLFLVIGPWFHHQQRLDGSRLGPIEFGSDTAAYFRSHLLRPFLDHFLKDDAPPLDLAPVNAFETGANRWTSLSAWPQGCAAGCPIQQRKFYFQPGGTLGLVPAARAAVESYVSDPAKPIPFLPRPIHLGDEAGEASWQTWLVSDQRTTASRTDVLSFSTPPLERSVKIAGRPIANLNASTSGTDGDFVVKVIDVYPDEMGRNARMGGYQLMISADIFRGRYRNSFNRPEPIPARRQQTYRFALPTANHVFLPGHRIMVQVQSTWFPVFERNPQTYVENIFFAKPDDYRKATIEVADGGPAASFVELPTATGPDAP